MKREKYKEAEFELIGFDCDDIITASDSSEIDPLDENQTELL